MQSSIAIQLHIHIVLAFSLAFLPIFCQPAKGQTTDSPLLSSILEEGETREAADQLSYLADSLAFTYQHDPLFLAERAVEIAKRNGYHEELGRAYFAMASVNRVVYFDYDKADRYYDSAIAILEHSDDYSTYGRCLIGKVHQIMKKTGAQGVRKQSYEAMKVCEKGDALAQAIGKEQLTYFLATEGRREETNKNLKELKEFYIKRGNPVRQLDIMDWQIHSSIVLKDTVNVEGAIREMEELATSSGLKYFVGRAHFLLGRLCFYRQDFGMALHWFLKGDDLIRGAYARPTVKSMSASYIAFCYENLADPDKTYFYWRIAIDRLKDAEENSNREWAINEFSKFFARNGKLDSALFYKNLYGELVKKQLEERKLHINELEELYQARETMAENERLEDELEFQEALFWGAVGIGILLFIVACLIFLSIREIRRRNVRLKESYKNVRQLGEIGRITTGCLSTDEITQESFPYVSTLLDISAYGVAVLNQSQHSLEGSCMTYKHKRPVALSISMNDKDQPAVACITGKKLIQSYNDAYWLSDPADSQGRLYQTAYLPLLHYDTVIGLLFVQARAGSLNEDHYLSLLRDISIYVSIAIQNYQKYYALLEKSENEKIVLETELEIKNRKLVSFVTDRMKQNEALEKLKADLAPEDGKTKRRIQSILAPDTNWQAFKLYFENVNPGFFEKLRASFPDLTPNEVRLCAFIKMGLSNKEIAELLSVTKRGVDKARERLNKKLKTTGESEVLRLLDNLQLESVLSH